MHVLFGKVKRQFIQVTILTLQHEEECLIVENRAGCHKESARKVVSTSHWNVAHSVVMIDLFVDKEVFAYDDDAARSDFTWYLN